MQTHSRTTSASSFASGSSLAESGQDPTPDPVYPPLGGFQSHRQLPHATPWYSVQAPVYSGYPPLTPPSSAESAPISVYSHPQSQVVNMNIVDYRQRSWHPPSMNEGIPSPQYYPTAIPTSVPSDSATTAISDSSRSATGGPQYSHATQNGTTVSVSGYPIIQPHNQPISQYEYGLNQHQTSAAYRRDHKRTTSMSSVLSFPDIQHPLQTGDAQQLPGIESFDNLRRQARSPLTSSTTRTGSPLESYHKRNRSASHNSSYTQSEKGDVSQCLIDDIDSPAANGSDPNVDSSVRHLQEQSLPTPQPVPSKNWLDPARIPISTMFSNPPIQHPATRGDVPATCAGAGDGMNRFQALVAVATASSENAGAL